VFNFVVPSYRRNRAYPALQKYAAEPYTQAWREFGQHSPYTVPCELIAHCDLHGYPYTITLESELEEIIKNNPDNIKNNPDNRPNYLYPVQWGWFSFDIDYIELLPEIVKRAVAQKIIRILFYYHEGDNPERIKARLDTLCERNAIDKNSYVFVSGNTAADRIHNGIHFNDHELLYYFRNKNCEKFFKTGVLRRDYRFLCLSRTHKWWRATVVADLARTGLLDASLWSYNTEITVDDVYSDNPIEVDTLGLRDDLTAFIAAGPYRCDDLTAAAHNDHTLHAAELYDNSYCSIVLETHFDADGSRGAFLTEKTFKCLKHGHPFIIAGAAGSLASLRSLGYRTFDSAIDTSYDTIEDNTQRYLAVRRSVEQIAALTSSDMELWFESLVPDLIHNSELFCRTKWDRLNNLLERINHAK
jgi:hypothetical protein